MFRVFKCFSIFSIYFSFFGREEREREIFFGEGGKEGGGFLVFEGFLKGFEFFVWDFSGFVIVV